MKKKTIFILLAVFAVLVLFTFIIEGPISKRGEKKAAKESILFPEFQTDQVSSVEIKTRGSEVKLKKESGMWVVATSNNYPADPKAVEDMLNKVKNLKSALVASKSSEKHPQFEVDQNSGVEVRLLGAEEKVLANFFVGKMGPDYMSTYVRKADQDQVLLISEYLKSVFDKGTSGWRDRTVLSFDSAQVQRLTLISQGKKETAIEAKDGEWQILKPEVFPADKKAVDEIVSDLSKLSADDFAEKKDLKEYKLDQPQSEIIADLKDGTSRVLLIGNEAEGRYYVKSADKEAVFTIYKSRIDRLFRDLGELKAKPGEEGKQEAEKAKPNEKKAKETP